MEKKPVTMLLKIVSILLLIQSVIGVLVGGLAIAVAPAVEEAAGENGEFIWLTLAVTMVCAIVSIVLAIMALLHKKIDLIYKISIFTLIISLVFSIQDGSGILSAIGGAVIPALFCYAAFNQNKIDQAQ